MRKEQSSKKVRIHPRDADDRVIESLRHFRRPVPLYSIMRVSGLNRKPAVMAVRRLQHTNTVLRIGLGLDTKYKLL